MRADDVRYDNASTSISERHRAAHVDMSVSQRIADSTASPSPSDSTVLFRTLNRIALITLNRPAALNALDHAMIEQVAARLEQCRHDDDIVAVVINSSIEKAFCAGGDVRALLRPGSDGRADIERYFNDEYRLDYAIHRFPKPVVVVMDAITMGGGMGLAQGAALRIATDRSRIAMPETKIGMVPDVGATHFLAAMPVELELYVGLTGVTLSGPDAVVCGLAEACVPHTNLADVEQRLNSIDARALAGHRDVLLAALRDAYVLTEARTGASVIERQREWITEHFRRNATPTSIVASLERALEGLEDTAAAHEKREWIEATLTALRSYSPTMIHVTREALLRGREITLEDSFRLEMGIVIRTIEEGDFREGVRAHLVDKDRAPKWKPDTLEAVTPEHVARFLNSPWSPDSHPLADLGIHVHP
jgi:enoyl-CoA hydratase/carnithine racemase